VSEQAIVKFSLYQADGTTPINATSLAITSTGDMKKGRAYDSDATTITTQSVSLTGLGGSTNNLYVALCNNNATPYTLTATDAAGNTYTYGPKTTTFTNGKYYEIMVKMHPIAVNLGLPSGTKWATMNVGAESVTDRGLYFAWGETTGYPFGTDHSFSWENYSLSTGSGYSNNDLTKYHVVNNAFDYTTLQATDDAAAANWGGSWRMPTKTEWQELLDNCSYTWQTNYQGSGMNGLLLTSTVAGYENKSIFLPADGYFNDNNNVGSTISIYYWSSSVDSEGRLDEYSHTYTYYPTYAYKLEALYDGGSFTRNPNITNEYRRYGMCIRAVQ
jgi:hypothetical protein